MQVLHGAVQKPAKPLARGSGTIAGLNVGMLTTAFGAARPGQEV